MRKLLFILFIFLIALITGCPTAPSGNTDTVSNSNTTPSNIPPEFSNKEGLRNGAAVGLRYYLSALMNQLHFLLPLPVPFLPTQ